MGSYKGELTDIVSLTGQMNVPCEVPEVQVPPVKANWGTSPGGKLPKLLLITNIVPSYYGDKVKAVEYVSYLSGFKKFTLQVPADFKVKRLTGTQAKKMSSKYREERLKNITYNLNHSFFIGCDPEVFVEDKDGVVFPAFNFLSSKQKNGLVYWDGFQAEFTTRAETCLAYLVDHIQEGLSLILSKARRKNKDAKLSTKTVVEVPKHMLESAKDEHVNFGCMPSLNIYDLKGKQVPARELPFRPAGGHLHFGIGKRTEKEVSEVVKALDAVLAVSCVPLFQNFDNPVRRQFYGLPGEYRLPPHGLEYRVLSNAWMIHPLLTHMVYELARKVVMFGLNDFRSSWEATEEETIETVINCDVARARQIMDRNKALLFRILDATPLKVNGSSEAAYNVFYSGLESAIKDPEDFVNNWNLDGGWRLHSDGPCKNWKTCSVHLVDGKKV